MPSVTTEGLILRRSNFGEADRVLTVLTDRYGKISVIARGVRKITSRRAGNIELLNRVKLHLFKSKSYTLQEAESIETYPQIKANLTVSTTAFHIIELVNRLVPEEQKNEQLYRVTVSILDLLEDNPRQLFVRAYEVKILSILGFWSIQAIPDLDLSSRKMLETMEDSSWRQISEIEINKDQAIALERILRYYIEKILESTLKSSKILKEMQKNG